MIKSGFLKRLRNKNNGEILIELFLFITLVATRFYMLGRDVINHDAFHFKNWSYVFMKEFEAGNWDKLFVAIQPATLTIYSNIIGFKFLYLFKDKFGLIEAEGIEFERLMHIYQKIPQTLFVIFLSCIIFFLLKKLFNFRYAVIFSLIYIFEPILISSTRFIQSDVLQSTLIVLSLLLFIFWHKNKKHIFFVLSALTAGLAFIEKSSTIAYLPFILISLFYLEYCNKASLRDKSFYINNILRFGVFIITFFVTAYIFFPAFWFHPVNTFLRMTLDAYIHGVGGVNLDSYNYVRPDNLGNPLQLKIHTDLLNVFLFWHTTIFIVGFTLGIISIIKAKSTSFAKKNIILFLCWGIFYFLVVQFSNLRLARYIIVTTIPFMVVVAYGYYVFASFLARKFNNAVSYILFILIFAIGLYNFIFFAPDWGAYTNIFDKINRTNHASTEGTGRYLLGQYLNSKFGSKQTVMIGDYTSLKLFYDGEVVDYDRNKIEPNQLIILTGQDGVYSVSEADYIENLDFKMIETYTTKGNINYYIYKNK